MLEVAEEGREKRIALFGERILKPGLKVRLWGDLGEPPRSVRVVFEGVRRSGMLMGGTGTSGRWKSGWGCTNACWMYLHLI